MLDVLKQARTDNVELRRNFDSVRMMNGHHCLLPCSHAVTSHCPHHHAQLKGMHLTLNEDHKRLQAQYSSLYEERVRTQRTPVEAQALSPPGGTWRAFSVEPYV